MWKRSQTYGVAAVAVMLVAGCETQPREEAGQAAREEAPPSEMAREEARLGAPLPKAVSSAESLTEDVQDDILAGNWTAAEKKTEQLSKLSGELKQAAHGQTAAVAMYDSAVTMLAQQVRARKMMPAALAANHAARAVVTIMSAYPLTIPSQVGMMDVSARDAMYLSGLGRWSDAMRAVDETATNYDAVRAHVQQADPSLDQRVRAEIDNMRTAVTGQKADGVRQAAGKLLEDVDVIEGTYR